MEFSLPVIGWASMGPPKRTLRVETLNDLPRLIAEVDRARREAGLTVRDVALRAGLHEAAFRDLLAGRTDPRLSTIRRLMAALDIEFEPQPSILEVSVTTPRGAWLWRYPWPDVVTAIGTMLIALGTLALVLVS